VLKSAIFAFICCSFLSFNAYTKEKVILDAEDDWAPYCSKVGDKAEGLAVDINRAIFHAVGINVEFKVVSYAKCIDDVTRKTEVVGCFDTARNSVNEKNFHWPEDPLFNAKVLIWTRKDFKENNLTYKDLKGKRVGVTNRYEYGPEFDGGPVGEVTKEASSTNNALFKKLAQFRYDLVVAYEFPAKIILNEPGMFREKAAIKSVGTLSNLELYVSFSKLNPKSAHFLKLYNKGVAIIKRNGTYKKLINSFEAKYE